MGLTIAELDSFTMGMIFDLVDEYVETYVKDKNNKNKPKARKATQADFNKF